jgi:hypothetical protein
MRSEMFSKSYFVSKNNVLFGLDRLAYFIDWLDSDIGPEGFS